jgi:hypothetical protein
MDKMTNVKALAYVLANCEIPADVAEKLTNIKTSYEKKSSGERKPTERQVANKGIQSDILEVMSKEPDRLFTVSELMKIVPSLDGLSNQRASAIVRGLKEDGLVERVEEKRKAFFQYKPQDSEGEEG